ncbi:hypothetical protein RJP21_23820 [Paenibacillus sp. VCA1]|uniref:hypothetical protein n=1 Tax=Paenibacillus sp. VCA1 TaxID=3039148 RepID=UPI002871A6C6|nr:hypothetical protein [Paenibacillus sp. VCA1]MDR9856635.1 hypothetical protein [Paenibacillus sp. VCA1]
MIESNAPNYFSISMYPTEPLDNEEALSSLLKVFESNSKLVPQQWGNSELIRLDYNRNEILEKSLLERKVSEVYLHRTSNIKYSGKFNIFTNSRSFLDFDFNKTMPQKFWSLFFQLSDQIAEIVKPRWGVTHISYSPTYPWKSELERLHIWLNLCSQPIPVRFLPNGPLGLGTRTYFGGHILELFGKDFLMNATGVVTELSWGGIRIDVSDNPWEVDLESFLEKWVALMNYLDSPKVMAIPSFDEDQMGVTFNPNISWINYLNKK